MSRILEKLGQEKLQELLQRIDECQTKLFVIKTQFEKIKKDLKTRKTTDSINEV